MGEFGIKDKNQMRVLYLPSNCYVDICEHLREFTPQELEVINNFKRYYPHSYYSYNSTSSCYTSSGGATSKVDNAYKRPIERGIKIKTQKDREEEKLKKELSSTDLASNPTCANANGLSIDADVANSNIYVAGSKRDGNSPTGTSDGIALFSD